jgi:hypothetical protein
MPGNYLVRDYVLIKQGYSFKAEAGKSMTAKIGIFPSLFQPNTLPGDTTSGANMGNPPAGGSYATQPDNDFSGLPMRIAAGSGQAGSSANRRNFLVPQLWFKTTPVSSNLNGLYRWYDVAAQKSQMNVINAQGERKEFSVGRDKITTYNFNPAIDLSYDSARKEIINKRSNLSQHTIIGIFGEYENFAENKFMFAVYGRKNEGILFSKEQLLSVNQIQRDSLLFSNENPGFLYNEDRDTSEIKFSEKSLRIGTFFKASQPDYGIWREPDTSAIIIGSDFQRTTNRDMIFSDYDTRLKRFKGFTPELLVFDKILSEQEVEKYETYLAVKYGITKSSTYYTSSGKKIWDYDIDSIYNHRIIAYGRDDGYGLLQMSSTTSHEESPFIANKLENDSYFMRDSYRRATQNRFLIAGAEKGNTMWDEDYTTIGDNNDSLISDVPVASDILNGIKRVRRVWQVRKTIADSSYILGDWENNGIALSRINNYVCNLNITASTSRRRMKSTQPLKTPNAYVGWKTGSKTGPVLIKFGTPTDTVQAGSSDCGYYFAKNGNVYGIVDGVESFYSVYTVQPGQYVEVEKSGNMLFLRIDGIRYRCTEITLPSRQPSADKFVVVAVPPVSESFEMTDFRYGGFSDTGNQIEVSFADQYATVLPPTSLACLLIDTTGTGNFQNPEVIFSETIDIERQKYIFRNIFWKCDADKAVHFSFGTYQSGSSGAKKQQEDIMKPDPDLRDDLKIYYSEPNNMTRVTVRVRTAELSPVDITIYDISGRRISQTQLPESNTVQFAEFRLPDKGVYIVNVVTNSRRYSQKMIAN